MPLNLATRTEFFAQLALLFPSLGITTVAAASADGISSTSETIHQEASFTANPSRVYAALTQTAQFDKVIRLSEAMKGGYPLGSAPTAIATQVGGTFSLFGGYITGRHIELIPNERIVQAWRTDRWKAGIYSIVRFELRADGSGTKLVFDHTGFPNGEAPSLAHGWRVNYWEPLAKYLA